MSQGLFQRAPITRLLAGLLLLLVGAALVAVGLRTTHEVYASAPADADAAESETISEPQLVIDATFTGVVRKDGHLTSTYDRGAPQGKQACPT